MRFAGPNGHNNSNGGQFKTTSISERELSTEVSYADEEEP